MVDSKYLTKDECEKLRLSCNELNAEKRGRITDDIEALRKEFRLGLIISTTLIGIFISVLGALIGSGVI